MESYRKWVYAMFTPTYTASESLEADSLHCHLLSECDSSPSLQTVTQQLWLTTRHFHYLVSRRLVEFTLLPLLYQFSRSMFGEYLTTLQHSLPSIAPSHLLLLSLTYLHHTLSLCLPDSPSNAEKTASNPVLYGLKLSGLETTLNSIVAGKCSITVGFVSNMLCEMLTIWLQLPHVTSSISLLCLKYLFQTSLPYVSSGMISQLLQQISLNNCNFTVFHRCIQSIPSTYFSQNYRSVIRYVNKRVSASLTIERTDVS